MGSRKKEIKIVYLSGPMTGLPNFNRAAFNRAARLLTKAGYIVLNPAAHPHGLTYHAYMDIDMAMVRASDAVCTLKGHQNSRGARAEIAYAESLGKPIYAAYDLLFTVRPPDFEQRAKAQKESKS